MKIKKSFGEHVFDISLYLITLIAMFLCLYPLWYVLVASFSNGKLVAQGEVTFWIKDFNFDAYKKAFATPYIGSSYLMTLYYSVFGVILSMGLTMLGAYPLSKKRLRGRKFFNIMITVTMWFAAGLLPTYITFRTYGLLDTTLGVLLHGAISPFYLIIMRNGFEGVPDALEESMRLDGASDIQIFWHVYIPLSIPTIMTLTLYYFVARWNTYFWPMVILTDERLVPLQVILKKLVVDMNVSAENLATRDVASTISQETMVFSTIIIAVVPMLILYPFIQRFFVKGITVGAVKG